MPSNETVAIVVLRDLELNFQCQTFEVAVLTRLRKCKRYYCRQIGIDLHFQGLDISASLEGYKNQEDGQNDLFPIY